MNTENEILDEEQRERRGCSAVFDPDGKIVAMDTDLETAIRRVEEENGVFWESLCKKGYSSSEGFFVMNDDQLQKLCHETFTRAEEKLKETVENRQKAQKKLIAESKLIF